MSQVFWLPSGWEKGVSVRRASTATTMHWEPHWVLLVLIRSGLVTAAVLIETLSAPALKTSLMILMSLMPPPTVKGMKTSSATLETRSMRMPRLSELAVMSRKTSSSAPSWL